MKLDKEKYKWLKDFKKYNLNAVYSHRLEFLKDMVKETWGVHYQTSYKIKRLRKHRGKGICKVCYVDKAICQHHIIMLSKNGPDASWNRISICKDCHEKIHPWMRFKK